MRSRTTLALLPLAAALAAAAPARADFVPSLAVELDPPTAASTSALTVTISQPPRDTAIERFTLNLPKGFRTRTAPDASVCAAADVAAHACPGSSRIGSVDALVGVGVAFTGSAHKTSDAGFVLLVSGLGGAVRQAVPGSLARRGDGSLDLTLDRLPALALSRLQIRLDGGGRSLLSTPKSCGNHTIDGKFTSRRDELALARTIVGLTGCRGVPAVGVTAIRMSKRRFRAGRRTVVAWSASRAADHTNVRVERRRKRGWRVVGVLVATAKQGPNVLRWDGRLRGRKLRAGRYRLRIQPAGSAPARPAVGFRILKPKKKRR